MSIYENRYWNLLREIVLFQFKIKDQSTFLGFMWSFLHPLMMLSILFIIFNSRMGEGIDHYGIYLLVGIVQYTHFSNSTIAGMRVLYSLSPLTKETVFPKELLVIGSVLSMTVEFLIAMAIAVVIAYFTGAEFSWTILLLPLVIVLQVMLTTWLSLVLSLLFLRLRDLEHIYEVFLRVLFFVTPIFYDPSYLSEGIAQKLVLLNPLTYLLEFARSIIIHGTLFPLDRFFFFLLINYMMIYFALKIFRKAEPAFAEYL